MPSSWGQPMIRSVMTTDLDPAASMKDRTSCAIAASLRISISSENLCQPKMPTSRIFNAGVRAVERNRKDPEGKVRFHGTASNLQHNYLSTTGQGRGKRV